MISTEGYSIRYLIPAIITVTLVLLSHVNWHIWGISSFMPLWGLIYIYYWTIYWPKVIPKWFIFFLGLLTDLLGDTPLGITSLIYLCFFLSIVLQRRFLSREPFWVIWLLFGVYSFILSLINTTLYSWYYNQSMISSAVYMQWFFSFALYPILHKIFLAIHEMYLK